MKLYNAAECKPGKPRLSTSDNGVWLSWAAMEALFEPVVKRIVNHVMALFEVAPECDYVLLVGGFAACTLLQHRLREALKRQHEVRLVVPGGPHLAVLQGAVRYGLSPPHITRRMKDGYGMAIAERMTEAHRRAEQPSYWRVSHGKREEYVSVYKVFVAKNQLVPADHVVQCPLLLWDTIEECQLRFMACSDETAPTYPDDPCLRPLGHISVHGGAYSKNSDRTVTVTVRFGGEEIQVSCLHDDSGNTASARVQYSTKAFTLIN